MAFTFDALCGLQLLSAQPCGLSIELQATGSLSGLYGRLFCLLYAYWTTHVLRMHFTSELKLHGGRALPEGARMGAERRLYK